MARTPDRTPGRLEEDEEIVFTTDPGAVPSSAGALTYDPALGAGAFQMRDGLGVFDPRSGGGLDAATHRVLDQLVHDLDETHEQVPTFNADGIITAVVAQGVGGGTIIRDYDLMAADSDGLITDARVRQRDGSGAVVETLTASVTIVSGVPTKNTVTRT
jgi:hypothetical protein